MPFSAPGMQGPATAGNGYQDEPDAGEEQQAGYGGRGDAPGRTPRGERGQRHVAGQTGDTGDKRYGTDRVQVITTPPCR